MMFFTPSCLLVTLQPDIILELVYNKLVNLVELLTASDESRSERIFLLVVKGPNKVISSF